MLERVIEGVKQSQRIDEVVVAAPHEIPCSVPLFIGDEFDVVKRYTDCCNFFEADIVVRITSDCPLIQGDLIDDCIDALVDGNYDHVAAIEPNYPDGLDVEVFTKDALNRTNEKAVGDEREHVGWYMRRAGGNIRIMDDGGYGHEKVSVDSEDDLERVRKIWTGEIRPYWWWEAREVSGASS